MEVWECMPRFGGWYFISNLGRVKSIASGKPKILAPVSNGSGYYQVKLITDGVRKSFYIHRLVAEHFVSGYIDGLEVDHLDNNKSNNRWDNLRWVSRRENMRKCHADNPHIMDNLAR